MAAPAANANLDAGALPKRSDAWTDLVLTVPIFVGYHLGVVFLPVRNAADPVTAELRALANHSLLAYAGITLGVGAVLLLVLFFVGERRAISQKRFFAIALEGTLYAVLMRFAGSYVVGALRLGAPGNLGSFGAVVMSLGAGFYEEIAFRVLAYGAVALLIRKLVKGTFAKVAGQIAWAITVACVFSGWHYVGAMGDPFDAKSFVFRSVCGLSLTAIFALRGFAPAVWTHAIYDGWVMLLG